MRTYLPWALIVLGVALFVFAASGYRDAEFRRKLIGQQGAFTREGKVQLAVGAGLAGAGLILRKRRHNRRRP